MQNEFTDSLTARLVAHCFQRAAQPLPKAIETIAAHTLLDWWGVLLAGWEDPAVAMLEAEILDEGCKPQSTLLGSHARTSAMNAALVNGMASHMLDFDDVHLRSRVHPSVPLWPAIVALAQRERLSGKRMLAAFVTGVEMQSRIAVVMGEEHYREGWHNTATLGMFGATTAAALLLGLDQAQTCHAIGLCATQAGGLRAAFGTPCKPFHAGRAAAAGIQSASLAKRGFESHPDMLACASGFMQLYGNRPDAAAMERALEDPGRYEASAIVFKYNASCYGTQAPIEAAKRLCNVLHGNTSEIESIHIAIEPQYISVCCIAEPHSPSEARFSISHVVALALAGWSTVDARSFSPAAFNDPTLRRLRARIHVRAESTMRRANAQVELVLMDGSRHIEYFDASRPEPDLQLQERGLLDKARVLFRMRMSAQRADSHIEALLHIAAEPDVAAFIERLAPSPA